MPARVWQISVPSTSPATLIVAGNEGRTELFITNNDPTITIFLGPVSGVTIGVGYPLYATKNNDRNRGFQIYLGPIYAIAASGTVDVRIWENYTIPVQEQIVGVGIDSGGNNNFPAAIDGAMYDDSGNVMYDDSGNPMIGT